MSKGKFALGALFGAAAGVVAGILTAPKSGKETRADIKAKKDAVAADVAGKVKTAETEAKDMAADAKVKARGVVDDVKANADDLRRRTESAVEGAKKGFNEKK